MLRFDAYFKQTVHESPNEYFRIRDVRIYYYLEDDSISVVEPAIENRCVCVWLERMGGVYTCALHLGCKDLLCYCLKGDSILIT